MGAHPLSLGTGDTIGDYQIIDVLGLGGMGKVFKVRNVISDRVEAMKVLLPNAGETQELADRFIREIKVVASLEHPNIALLRTALRVNNQLLMIMEYVEGSSLDAKLRAGTLEMRQAVGYMCQVLSALSYAHQHGVIHRDVKPSNILINAQDKAKLTDFGIASKAGDPRLTATGMALGSLYYMSPEQIRAVPLDARSDLYSVGVTLYEMVTGRRPIQGDSFYAIMKGHLEYRPPAPIQLSPHVPPELSRIIEKSLEKAPEQRFQTAEEFRGALMGIGSPGESGHVAVAPRKADTGSAAGLTTTKSLDAAFLEKAKNDLAVFIGPMAKLIVNRAARSARSRKELYEILAAEIPSPGDRQKFLASRPL
ncbi:MAG: serine/threonine-protein kinase [Terriglobia bacterium]